MIDIGGKRVCGLLGIEFPIIQGGMAWVSDHKLVVAVSEAGGLGTIGAGHMPPDVLDKEILETKARTSKSFAVNLMLMNPDVEQQMDVVIKRRVPIVVLGAGDASGYIKKFHNEGIKVLVIAPSIALVKRSARREADAIIVEGSEAGGHIGKFSTMTLLPAVVDFLKSEDFDIPVIAAGGICDGRSMVAAIVLGASAVQMGTRFVLARETNVHAKAKKAYIDAKDVTKVCITGQALNLPAQCLRNNLTKEFSDWEREFIEGGRTNNKKEEIELRAVGRLREAMQEGNIKTGSIMAGQCVIRLNKDKLNQAASEIINEIMTEASDVLDRMPRSLYDEMFKISNLKPCLPIIQGGMAVRLSEAPLAAAVADEGGIGVIGASGMGANWLRREIRKARLLSKGIIGVNIMVIVKEFEDLVQVAVEEADLLIIGAGFPDRHYLTRIKDLIPTFLIVSDSRHVPLAMKLGLAGVILESGKAGGHLGTDENKDIWEMLEKAVDKMKVVKKEADGKPSLKTRINPHFNLIAAGGILTGYDIARALEMGASAVQMGTLFAVALESSAHDKWKETVRDAEKDDIITIASPIRPERKKMPLRVVKTPFVKELLKGNIPKLSIEFQEKFCKNCLGDCARIFCIFRALLNARNGKIDFSREEDSETINEKQASVVTIGYRGYEIKVINKSVKEIIKELDSEFTKY